MGDDKMLTNEQLDLLWNIEIACQRCIRAASHFEVASNSKSDLWSFTQNCYGAMTVIHWCQIFGAYDEPTHFSSLFKNGALGGMLKEHVSNRLCAYVRMSQAEYNIFHKATTDARNKYFVHNEFKSELHLVFPDLDILKRLCLEMRNIIREIVVAESSENPVIHSAISESVSFLTNDRLLDEIQVEAGKIETILMF
jgi:hypothetical protein